MTEERATQFEIQAEEHLEAKAAADAQAKQQSIASVRIAALAGLSTQELRCQKTAADDLPFIDGDSAKVGAEEGGARSNILSSLDS